MRFPDAMTDDERMLKPREVAELLGVHINTVKRLGDRGEMAFYRIGSRGDRRFRRADVEEYLSRRAQPYDRRRASGDARDADDTVGNGEG
jgi:excisionase family DNA binding protein